MRIAVPDILGWLAAGESHESILSYHPDLEEDDLRAALTYAERVISGTADNALEAA